MSAGRYPEEEITMTNAVIKPRWTFEEYVDFCAQANEPYELVQGELQPMTPPEWQHIKIAKFLERLFDAEIERLGHPWEAFRETGQRTNEDSSRLPDVSVIPLAMITQFLNQTAILQVPALLVVEIVSTSSASEYYNDKLQEYEALKIPEYWVADYAALGAAKYLGFPKKPTLTINQWVAGAYQGQQFRGSDRIVSPTFPELALTAEQILQAGREGGSTP
jgi:Uma2 family endonuclease